MADKFVIATGVVSEDRKLVVLRSERLMHENAEHCFLVEAETGGFTKVTSKSANVRGCDYADGVYLFASHAAVFQLGTEVDGYCSSIEIPKDVGLLHRIKVCDGRFFLLAGKGLVLSSRPSANIAFHFDMDGIENEKLLNDLYQDDAIGCTVGFNGSVWMRTGYGRWSREDVGTNTVLTSVTRHDNNIIICGLGGTLIKGSNGAWEHLEHDFIGSDFWALDTFGDRVFALSDSAVFELNESSVEIVLSRDQGRGIFREFSSNQTELWAIGEKLIAEFDGERWEELVALD